MRKIQNYGWINSKPDFRDFKFASIAEPIETSQVNDIIDLTPFCPPVLDQGTLGSCTSNGLSSQIQFVRMKLHLPNANLIPSRLMIYFMERQIENTIMTDCGAEPRDGLSAASKYGVCFESGPDSWPYDITKFTIQPPQSCYQTAKTDEVTQYYALNQNYTELKTCLLNGYPFGTGISVYESFESDVVAQTGIVPMPGSNEGSLGGHYVYVVGDIPEQKRFKLRNSWGQDWGSSGGFTLPYDYILNPDLADDFWTVRLTTKS